ncbi:hypothetical protein ACFPTO_14595 [Paraburkholderia denitrificans]|uniref:Uncharacterized protein n=1 Tax=Paraburkholderia denitrificans TaxID=694025 RepID=A0ABW0JA84_9BURK
MYGLTGIEMAQGIREDRFKVAKLGVGNFAASAVWNAALSIQQGIPVSGK